MKKIQIICTNPGMRRHGIEHPASAVYDADRWSPAQLAAFKEDPAFVVQEIDDNAVVMKSADFETAVTEEVSKRLDVLRKDLQASFDQAVKDASAEKVAAAEKRAAVAEEALAALKAASKDSPKK